MLATHTLFSDEDVELLLKVNVAEFPGGFYLQGFCLFK